MTIRGDELLHAAEIVAQERNLQVALKHSVAAGAIAGVTTVVSSLALGPPGILVGGALGGVLGYAVSKDKFKPLHKIIKEDLTQAQKQALIYHLNEALKDFDINDAIMLASLVLSDNSIETAIAKCLITFSQNNLKGEIKSKS